MFKIDSTGATPSGEFQPADPVSGAAATRVSYEWFNAVQRELINVITAGGLTPSKANDAQLLAAIQELIDTGVAAGGGGGGGVEPLYEVQARQIEGATTTPTVYVRQTKIGKFVNITVSGLSDVVKDSNSGPIQVEISAPFIPEDLVAAILPAKALGVYGGQYFQVTSTGKLQMYNTSGGNWFAAGATGIGWTGNLSISFSLY